MRTDAELVASARSGDRDAFSTIYDRYADRLYDLCSSVLRDPDAAFDTMVDTFVLTALEMYRLRDPEKLEEWLFALAREQLLARQIPIGVDAHAEFNGAAVAPTTDGTGAIVWEAASWLPGRDRILLDLHARQPLGDQALAVTMGVSLPHAVALVRDLDERLERLLSALLVARLSSPGCHRLESLIAGEDEHHPDTWLRQIALHVDVCRKCLLWREDQPSAVELISEVPSEPAPLEVRDEVLDRVDLLWSQLGPSDWAASVAAGNPPAHETSEETAASAVLPPETTSEEIGESAALREKPEPEVAADATGDDTGEMDAPVESDGYAGDEYDEYDEIESLVPPPPRLRRNGFPRRSMYPARRRRVYAAAVVLTALVVAAIVTNFRGFGPQTDRFFAAEAEAAARHKAPTTTTTATTAPATTAGGPDTRPPFVFNLATVYGCIGPKQTSTPALASVVDPQPGRLASVELVFVDANGTETRRQMTRSGGGYEGPIGPYTVDGTITWQVIGTDAAGNAASASGPPVAAMSTC
jgi:DNA-directed RNA polymerase specialized sigma24 family protein